MTAIRPDRLFIAEKNAIVFKRPDDHVSNYAIRVHDNYYYVHYVGFSPRDNSYQFTLLDKENNTLESIELHRGEIYRLTSAEELHDYTFEINEIGHFIMSWK